MLKLILMPGMDGTGELFAPLVDALGDSIETCVLRYPPDEPLGYAELLPRVRAALPTSDPFVLLGESFSGPLAIMAAAEAPAGLRGVILSASFANNPMRWFPKFARALVQPALFRALPRSTQVKAILGRDATPELRTLLWNAVSAVSPQVMAARARAVLAVDVMPQFKACRYPILYLRGQRDRVVRKSVTNALLLAKPSMQVVTLPASHLVLQVAPIEAAKAIREFVRAVSGAATT
jgi:pimeloyl-ACP methyl ester carboxylesterase